MTLNYKVFGQGEPLIILHGLLGMLDNWQSIAKILSNNYTVYILDQRNHGNSPHSPEFNFSVLANDIVDFMTQQHLKQCSLMGHSLGGKVAMLVAVNNPEKIKKLIVVDIAPKTYPNHHESIFKSLFSLNLSTLTSRVEAENELKTHIESYSTVQFLLKNLTRNSEGNFIWKFNLLNIYANYTQICENPILKNHKFLQPSLFIKGSHSNYINIKNDTPIIIDTFKLAKIIEIKNAGHWVHADNPIEFINVVSNFLLS